MSNFQNIILVFILCVALPVLCEHQDVGEINIFGKLLNFDKIRDPYVVAGISKAQNIML